MSAEYLLHCSSCNEYTSLGRYVEKEGRFQGEYSLLHNRHLNGDDMLCRFLIRHTGHPLTMHANRTEAYSDILKQAHRFMEGDIDAYLEQVADRREQQAHDIQMERGLGRLQLYILREMLAKEAESLSKRAYPNLGGIAVPAGQGRRCQTGPGDPGRADGEDGYAVQINRGCARTPKNPRSLRSATPFMMGVVLFGYF
ncbi:hypothetical protein LJK87_46465 [Paenibacillus sp. P25]|nr:hypothetical protein LJK87_46465 [Paenibacillus sp. P25]